MICPMQLCLIQAIRLLKSAVYCQQDSPPSPECPSQHQYVWHYSGSAIKETKWKKIGHRSRHKSHIFQNNLTDICRKADSLTKQLNEPFFLSHHCHCCENIPTFQQNQWLYVLTEHVSSDSWPRPRLMCVCVCVCVRRWWWSWNRGIMTSTQIKYTNTNKKRGGCRSNWSFTGHRGHAGGVDRSRDRLWSSP